MKFLILLLMMTSLGLKAHGHGGGAEAQANVGPDKGILAFEEKKSFQLSPEATKNFGIRTQKITEPGTAKIPASSLMRVGETKAVYRIESGFYLRVPFAKIKTGDEIVVQGVDFLRAAELTLEAGEEEGEHHDE